MISKEEVKHIAKLARLGLTEKELKEMQKELSKILDYIEKLKKVDIEKVSAISYSFISGLSKLKENQARKDVVINFDKKVKNIKLLEQAPQTEQGFLKVKSIF